MSKKIENFVLFAQKFTSNHKAFLHSEKILFHKLVKSSLNNLRDDLLAVNPLKDSLVPITMTMKDYYKNESTINDKIKKLEQEVYSEINTIIETYNSFSPEEKEDDKVKSRLTALEADPLFNKRFGLKATENYNKYKRNTRIAGLTAAAAVGVGLYYKNRETNKKNERFNILKELANNPELFNSLDKKYTNDPIFCLEAIGQNKKVFNFINDTLKKDEDFILQAIMKQPNILSLIMTNKKFKDMLKSPFFIKELEELSIDNQILKPHVEKLKNSLSLNNNSNRRTPRKGTSRKGTSRKGTSRKGTSRKGTSRKGTSRKGTPRKNNIFSFLY